MPDKYFFEKSKAEKEEKLVWEEKDLKYNYDPSNLRETNLTIPVTKRLLNNDTLFLHVEIETPNPYFGQTLTDQDGKTLSSPMN